MIRKKITIVIFGIILFAQPLSIHAYWFSSLCTSMSWLSNKVNEHKIASAALATVFCSTLGIMLYEYYSTKSKSIHTAVPQIPKTSTITSSFDIPLGCGTIDDFDNNNFSHRDLVNDLCTKDYYLLWTLATKEDPQKYISHCKAYFNQSKYKKIIAVEKKPVGFIAYNYGAICLLDIDEKYRGKKLGSQLIHYAINHLKELGCTKVRLLVRNTNTHAQALYKKFGFVKKYKGNPTRMKLSL